MQPTIRVFVWEWIASGLVDQAEADRRVRELPNKPASAEELAKSLVNAGVLTKFQAQ